MKEIHRYVTNPEITRRLREAAGLGAASTRAKIVELMIKRDYVTMDKKLRLTSTQVARKLIDVIDTRLSDPGMTAMWEDALDAIAEGKFERSQFLTTVRKEITGLVPIVKNSEFKAVPQKPLPGHGETCKACGKGQMFTRTIKTKDSPKGERVLACSAYNRDDPAGCRNVIWPPKVPPLPGDGTACPNCKAAGRNGTLVTKSYLPQGERKHVGFLVCTLSKRDDPTSCDYRYRAQSSVPPLPDNGKQCPKCGPGRLVTKAASSDANKGRRFYGCSTATYVNGVKGGCDHFEWGDPPKGGARSGSAGAKGKTAGAGRPTARSGAGTRSSR
jgi:DNA topoisomerase-3